MRKVKYQNWVYEVLNEKEGCPADVYAERQVDPEIELKVKQALDKLSEQERIFIEEFYFQGKSYKEISSDLKLNSKQLEYLHRRAVFKLRNLLSDFVEKKFKIKVAEDSLDVKVKGRKSPSVCVICQNPKQKEIEKVINSKREYQTWGVILRKIKTKFDLKVRAPQILIGHMKHKLN